MTSLSKISLSCVTLSLALAPAAAAVTAVDQITVDFESGLPTVAGWSFQPTDTLVAGPTGQALHQAYVAPNPTLTIEPQLATTPWVGDLRAAGVTRISLDAATQMTSAGVGAGFAMTVLLRDTKGSELDYDDDFVFFVGPEIPLSGAGWKHFDFDIPSASTEASPAGWSGGWYGDSNGFRPGVEWSDVITSIDEIEICWGYNGAIHHYWDVSADNLVLEHDPSTSAIVDVGHALQGATGVPRLTADGDLTAGSTLSLFIDGLGGAPASLIGGPTAAHALFKGGVLVPDGSLVIGLGIPADGLLAFPTVWPSGVPSGAHFYLQTWFVDASGPQGLTATNGLRLTAP